VSENTISVDLNEKLLALQTDLQSPSEATQLKVIVQFEDLGENAIAPLSQYLIERQIRQRQANQPPNYLDGRAFQIIRQNISDKADRSSSTVNQKSLQELDLKLEISVFQGILPLPRSLKIDLAPLQALLADRLFEDADRLNSKIMCQLAGDGAATRGWIYFSEIAAIAPLDLQTIDQLWTIYSEGKFGYAIQRRLWASLGKKWEDFWLQIGWKKDGSFTRYPGGFSWNIKAPKGHLPLSNQIRGNKTMEAIFNHPAWK
jgi:GUN4-like/ARM-like repeat domain, GUN4-N terminal